MRLRQEVPLLGLAKVHALQRIGSEQRAQELAILADRDAVDLEAGLARELTGFAQHLKARGVDGPLAALEIHQDVLPPALPLVQAVRAMERRRCRRRQRRHHLAPPGCVKRRT